MVQFEDDTHAALLSAGILMIDENGNTVFTGLTTTETQFVLDFEESQLSTDQAKTEVFQELMTKFHAARKIAMGNAEQLANAWLAEFHSPPLAR